MFGHKPNCNNGARHVHPKRPFAATAPYPKLEVVNIARVYRRASNLQLTQREEEDGGWGLVEKEEF